jgi:hypothetical protein
MDETLSLADTLKCLTMDDIKEALPHNTFSPTEKRSCTKLDEAVWKLSGAHHTVLGEAAESKKRRRLAKHPPPS